MHNIQSFFVSNYWIWISVVTSIHFFLNRITAKTDPVVGIGFKLHTALPLVNNEIEME